jgi:hypothetical protein
MHPFRATVKAFRRATAHRCLLGTVSVQTCNDRIGDLFDQ